jgi:hypothetical protein
MYSEEIDLDGCTTNTGIESCQDYKCVVPLRKEVVIIDADLLNGELSTRAMFIYN